MPIIYDNIERVLADALCRVLPGARGADFCIGYFNLLAGNTSPTW